jgi:hypothetical protein
MLKLGAQTGDHLREQAACRHLAYVTRFADQVDLQEDLSCPIKHPLPIPELIRLDKEIEYSINVRRLLLHCFFKPGSDRAFLAGGFAVDALNILVGQHLNKIFLLEEIRLTGLFNLSQKPAIVLMLNGPELLEFSRKFIIADELSRRVMHIIVTSGGTYQGRKFQLVGLLRVANIYQIHTIHLQVFYPVDLVIPDHPPDLGGRA